MSKLCKKENCKHASSKREMCEMHYRRWWRENNKEWDREYGRLQAEKRRRSKGILSLKEHERTCASI